MVKITAFLPLLLTPLLLVTANPTPEIEKRHNCLNDGDAAKLLKIYISFFEKLDRKKAEKYLAPDFFEVSASLNFIFGKNYDAVTYTNRTDFIDQTVAQQSAPLPPGGSREKFTVLDTVHSCKTIWFRWNDNSKPVPLYGFDEFYLEKKHDCWVITKAYSEFNNAAILFNAGLFPCPSK